MKKERVIREDVYNNYYRYCQLKCSAQQKIEEVNNKLKQAQDYIAYLEDEKNKVINTKHHNAENQGNIGTRERISYLKIIDAFLALGNVLMDHTLVGKLEKKCEQLYGDEKLSNDTIRNKIKELKRLHE